jgi:hypothetical protein
MATPNYDHLKNPPFAVYENLTLVVSRHTPLYGNARINAKYFNGTLIPTSAVQLYCDENFLPDKKIHRSDYSQDKTSCGEARRQILKVPPEVIKDLVGRYAAWCEERFTFAQASTREEALAAVAKYNSLLENFESDIRSLKTKYTSIGHLPELGSEEESYLTVICPITGLLVDYQV